MPKKFIYGITVLMILSGFLVLWYGLKYRSNPAPSKPLLLEIATQPVKTKSIINSIEAVGTTKAYESVTISANVTEYVEKLHFEDGDRVKKGALLVELRKVEEKAQLAEATARLEEAQAQFNRIQNLLNKNFSAQSEYDAQKANVASAKAQLKRIESNITDRTITAPFDGILGFRLISDGTLVEPGDQIVTLDMIQPLRLDFTIPEKYLSKVKPGASFTAQSIAFPKQQFSGTITTINARIDEQSRSVLLRGRLANENLNLKPGMLLRVRLPLGEQNVILIPEEAMLADGNQRYIFILDKEKNRVKRVEIRLIQREGNRLYITADIPNHAQVVTAGAFRLKDGQEVRVRNAAE